MNMKVCVTASDKRLDVQLDPGFGRCNYFIIVDSETLEYKAISNTAASAMHGARIQAAQTVIEKGVEAVITGNVGPNAYRALSTAGIKILTGAKGTVKGVVEQYKRGELQAATDFTARPHSGGGPKGNIYFGNGKKSASMGESAFQRDY
jgi:predicted Fe-Mo cluster-binding NifX family protein